jgi:hypothetical protein
MTSLYSRIVVWSNLPLSSVRLFAAGFSEQHLKEADSTFRDPNDRLKIMIATSAYSLGIDAFIRSVIHYSVPSDIASYLQGIGRCGRDPSIEEAHCTLVIDGVGLQAADKEMRVFLGCARVRPKKPAGSSAMAQCSVCLTWRHLAKDVALLKQDEIWLCESAGAVCSNVTRLPCCVTVMSLRFLRREACKLDDAFKAGDERCNRCDWCVPPSPADVPSVADFVCVISATHKLYNHIGQVTAVSDDRIMITVNFGGVFCAEQLPYNTVVVSRNVILAPSQPKPTHSVGPIILKRLLKDTIENQA